MLLVGSAIFVASTALFSMTPVTSSRLIVATHRVAGCRIAECLCGVPGSG